MDEPVNIATALYVKHGDISGILGDLTFILCSAMDAVVRQKTAVAAQRIRGVWLLYVDSDTSRSTILQQGYLTVCNMRIQVHDTDPFARRPQTERVFIRDYPITAPPAPLLSYLKSQPQIQIYGDISFSMARGSQREMSNYTNGDRVIEVVADFTPPLPKDITLGGHPCRIYHATQKLICFRCQKNDHYTGEINKCDAYLPEVEQRQIMPFKSPRSPLSNYWESEMKMDGLTFPSSEHAYLWSFCLEMNEPELAERVFNAPSPPAAKAISKEMSTNKIFTEWTNTKLNVMKKVLAAKAETNEKFLVFLLNTGNKYLVEATKDVYYGSGLTPHLSRTTKISLHPGANHLGKLLMELRAKHALQLDNTSMTTHGAFQPKTSTPSIVPPSINPTPPPISTAPPATTLHPPSNLSITVTPSITNTVATTSATPLVTSTTSSTDTVMSVSDSSIAPTTTSAVTQDVSTAVHRAIRQLRASAGSGNPTRKHRKTVKKTHHQPITSFLPKTSRDAPKRKFLRSPTSDVNSSKRPDVGTEEEYSDISDCEYDSCVDEANTTI